LVETNIPLFLSTAYAASVANSKTVEVELVIDSLSPEGRGLASYQKPSGSRALVEVPLALPGDRIRANIRTKARRRQKGRMVELLAASLDRVSAPCPHSERCGGCRFQQMNYRAQLEHKMAEISRLFSGYAVPIAPILPCEPHWHQRNKMEFTFSQGRDGKRLLGLHGLAGKGEVVDLTDCHTVSPWMMEALGAVRGWWAETLLPPFWAPRGTGLLRTLTLRHSERTEDRLALLTVAGGGEQLFGEHSKKTLADYLPGCSLVVRYQQAVRGSPTRFAQEVVSGTGFVHEKVEVNGHSLLFRVSPTAFFQPCTQQAEQIFSQCLALAPLTGTTRVLDLCCGTGPLGLIAGLISRHVVGVDIDGNAVADARHNAGLNDLTHVRFENADITTCHFEEFFSGAFPEVIMLDPPRAGLAGPAIAQLAKGQAERIIYVSCNPASQVEDIRALVEAGYALLQLQPIDQFPHTPHIENIALLSRQSK
jgi:23S rRNA (uracil1939-C5)-methyltransferase